MKNCRLNRILAYWRTMWAAVVLLCNAHTHTAETSAIIAIDEKLFSSLSVPISTGGDWRPITSPKVPKQCLKLGIFFSSNGHNSMPFHFRYHFIDRRQATTHACSSSVTTNDQIKKKSGQTTENQTNGKIPSLKVVHTNNYCKFCVRFSCRFIFLSSSVVVVVVPQWYAFVLQVHFWVALNWKEMVETNCVQETEKLSCVCVSSECGSTTAVNYAGRKWTIRCCEREREKHIECEWTEAKKK